LLAVFLFTASRKARRLLALLTFAPVITLPVVRLVQHLLVPGSGPAEQAEVLLSGLFKNLSIPNQPAAANAKQEQTLVPIDRQLLQLVDEDLRLRLRDGLRVWEARQVFDAVKEQVAKSLNRSTDQFEALLRNPRDSKGENFEALLAAFATVAPSCLRGLGQSYEDLANDIEAGWSSYVSQEDSHEPWPKEHFTFEDLPYETAKLLPIPAPDLISFSTARYQEIELLPISFETAKLTITTKPDDRTKKKSSQQPVVEIHRSRGSAQAFYEPLQRENLPPGAIAEAADPLTLTLVEIPKGEFPMGSPPEEPERYDDEGPQHLVKLESFFMAQTPITQAQWREVAGWQPWDGESWGRELKPNPSHFRGGDNQKGGKARLFDGEANTDQRPVEQVNWEDAIEFCNRLSQRTGRHYSLPSEAQWEYACRAGSITPFHFGETLSSELANFGGTEVYAGGLKGDWRRQTTPVGKSLASVTSADAFPANDWGLQDMHGNVWEWCLDQWHPSYEGAPLDGSAWVDADANQANIKKDEESNDRLLRGGSWNDHPGLCRSAVRIRLQPGKVYDYVGLRVVCLPQGCSS
jgi:formylglycine-generating enzyme required for sulfatase activity